MKTKENKKITLTCSQEEFELIEKAAKDCSLRLATFCKMLVMEHFKNEKQKS